MEMRQGALVVALAIAMSSFPALAAGNETDSPDKSFIEKIVDLVLQQDQDANYSQTPAPDTSRSDFKPPPDKGGGGLPGGLCWVQGATIICQAM
jgi:hypothetical protein